MALLQKLYLPKWSWARGCSSVALEVGAKASFSRRLSRQDVDAFTALSGDSNPVHRGTKAVVHGALLNALVSCAMGTLMPGPGSMVVGQSIKYPHPCHADEWVTVSVVLTGMKMDLLKCRYTVMAKPHEDSPLADARLVLSGDASLIMVENQKRRAKKRTKITDLAQE